MGYKRLKVSNKILAAALVGCFCFGMVPDKIIQANSVLLESDKWSEVESIVSQYYGEWQNTEYKGAITDRTPHTALLGNGDMGVTSYGNSKEKTYLISKGDFWSAGDLKTQAPFGLDKNRTQIVSLGGVTIKSGKKDEEEKVNNSLTIGENVEVEASGHHDNFTPQYLINGEIENSQTEGWVSPEGSNHWVKIDLGESKKISKYVIYHHGAARPEKTELNTSDFKVSISDDGENWTEVHSVTGNKENVTEVILDQPVTARYVKIDITKPTNTDNDSRARMTEIELFENPEDESIHKIKDEAKLENYEKQNIIDATLKTEMKIDDTPIEFNTWTSATDNVMVSEITSKGTEPLKLSVEAWATENQALGFPTESGVEEDIAWASRSTYNGAPENPESWLSKATIATKVIGDKEVNTEKNSASKSTINFEIEPDETVYLVTTVGGGGQTYDNEGNLKNELEPLDESFAVLKKADTEKEIGDLYQSHTDWWKDYWMKSYVDLEDDELEEYYYGSLYYMGATAREDKMASGLYGVWRTTDTAYWSGDFHLNYNFEGPFYGMYSSNRYEGAYSMFQPVLDFMPEAERRSKEALTMLGGAANDYINTRPELKDGIEGGVIYPVGLGPWGSVTDKVYLSQTLNAPFVASSFISYYNYTQDEEFLRDVAYPFLEKVATFYLSWCEKEDLGNGTYRYNLYDGPHEGSFAKNSGVTIGLVKNVLNTLLNTTDIHNASKDKVEAWKDLYDNIADIPVRDYKGTDVYALTEDGEILRTWEQSVNLEFIHPGEQLGFNSSPEALKIANDTIRVRQEEDPNILGNINNTGKEYLHGVLVGYDSKYLVDKFKEFNINKMQENFTIDDGYHGIEKAGAIEMINRMMMQSQDGIIKVFPNWLEDDDAKFVDLREKGAFLVSSEYDGDLKEVKYVDIFSEKGKDVSIVSPWTEGAIITDEAGKKVHVTKGTTAYTGEVTYSFKTEAGKKYYIRKGTPNKDVLMEVVKSVEKLNKADYTDSSWAVLEQALEAANAVLASEEATQDEIDSAKEALENAINSLKKGDKEALILLINKISELNAEEYTSSTWKKLQKELDIANEVVGNENASEDKVMKTYGDLMSAFLELSLKPNKDKLQGLIDEAENIDSSKYTKKSLKVLDKALEKAKKVFANEEATEKELAKAENYLEVALASLVEENNN